MIHLMSHAQCTWSSFIYIFFSQPLKDNSVRPETLLFLDMSHYCSFLQKFRNTLFAKSQVICLSWWIIPYLLIISCLHNFVRLICQRKRWVIPRSSPRPPHSDFFRQRQRLVISTPHLLSLGSHSFSYDGMISRNK